MEAEENQLDSLAVGVKHSHGGFVDHNDTSCWAITGSSADSVIYGPHYRQWKMYKRW